MAPEAYREGGARKTDPAGRETKQLGLTVVSRIFTGNHSHRNSCICTTYKLYFQSLAKHLGRVTGGKKGQFQTSYLLFSLPDLFLFTKQVVNTLESLAQEFGGKKKINLFLSIVFLKVFQQFAGGL